ncbi:MAG: ASCH domain-containing protein [Candidatus Levybacteria bacterium]|nr:ASCH domain-containing protein [Candidatus Levybacteria bacterium]
MHYNLSLKDRPFRAIKVGTKKIETRVPTSYDKTPYKELKFGDTIIFTNKITNEVMEVEVLRVAHYLDIKTLLEAEGIQNTLSSGLSLNEATESYNTVFSEYKENIPKHGIYAIAIKLKEEE